MDRQCSSCGGFCKKSGCERENAPPEKEWVGLTDDDVMSLLPGAIRLPPGWADTVRAIEAKLKEKNNG